MTARLYEFEPNTIAKDSEVFHSSFPEVVDQHLQENKPAEVMVLVEQGKKPMVGYLLS